MNASRPRSFFIALLTGILAILTSAANAVLIYRTVALTGMHAPGTPDCANFSVFGSPLLDASGRTAFHAILQTISGGVTYSNDEGIWSEGSGTLTLVAREQGSQAPARTFGSKFRQL